MNPNFNFQPRPPLLPLPYFPVRNNFDYSNYGSTMSTTTAAGFTHSGDPLSGSGAPYWNHQADSHYSNQYQYSYQEEHPNNNCVVAQNPPINFSPQAEDKSKKASILPITQNTNVSGQNTAISGANSSKSSSNINEENVRPVKIFCRRVTSLEGDVGVIGEDIFFHISSVVKGTETPKTGDNVLVQAEAVSIPGFKWNAKEVQLVKIALTPKTVRTRTVLPPVPPPPPKISEENAESAYSTPERSNSKNRKYEPDSRLSRHKRHERSRSSSRDYKYRRLSSRRREYSPKRSHEYPKEQKYHNEKNSVDSKTQSHREKEYKRKYYHKDKGDTDFKQKYRNPSRESNQFLQFRRDSRKIPLRRKTRRSESEADFAGRSNTRKNVRSNNNYRNEYSTEERPENSSTDPRSTVESLPVPVEIDETLAIDAAHGNSLDLSGDDPKSLELSEESISETMKFLDKMLGIIPDSEPEIESENQNYGKSENDDKKIQNSIEAENNVLIVPRLTIGLPNNYGIPHDSIKINCEKSKHSQRPEANVDKISAANNFIVAIMEPLGITNMKQEPLEVSTEDEKENSLANDPYLITSSSGSGIAQTGAVSSKPALSLLADAYTESDEDNNTGNDNSIANNQTIPESYKKSTTKPPVMVFIEFNEDSSTKDYFSNLNNTNGKEKSNIANREEPSQILQSSNPPISLVNPLTINVNETPCENPKHKMKSRTKISKSKSHDHSKKVVSRKRTGFTSIDPSERLLSPARILENPMGCEGVQESEQFKPRVKFSLKRNYRRRDASEVFAETAKREGKIKKKKKYHDIERTSSKTESAQLESINQSQYSKERPERRSTDFRQTVTGTGGGRNERSDESVNQEFPKRHSPTPSGAYAKESGRIRFSTNKKNPRNDGRTVSSTRPEKSTSSLVNRESHSRRKKGRDDDRLGRNRNGGLELSAQGSQIRKNVHVPSDERPLRENCGKIGHAAGVCPRSPQNDNLSVVYEKVTGPTCLFCGCGTRGVSDSRLNSRKDLNAFCKFCKQFSHLERKPK